MKKFIAFCWVMLFISCHPGYALEKLTHERINAITAPTINQSLLNIGFRQGVQETINGKKIIQWIQQGGIAEDEPVYTRSRNHFHDPLLPWVQAGLNKGIFTGLSSALWMQDQTDRRVTDRGGDWSWEKARQFYYAALTGNSIALHGFTQEEAWYRYVTVSGSIKMTEEEKNRFYAWTFRAVGQTMHLLEDASVPSHTRNDVHSAYDYEGFVDKVRDTESLKFASYISNPRYFTGPINNIASFVDTDQYVGTNPEVTYSSNIGLAEYTNANFFSEDTIFNYYPHPTYSETTYPNIDWTHPETADAEDGKVDNRIYISRTIGDADARLAAISFISYDCIRRGYNKYVAVQDDVVYNDYASLLLPRAAGYATGLLNYFFRGTIDIALPESGFYASASPSDAGFKTIKVLAQNITENDEQMTDGSIELVVKYQPTQDAPLDYHVASESTGRRTIPRDNPVELTFDLSRNPIPFTATDVYLQLVYHGRLGTEDGAVAVGFKDISEPTPIDIYNNMDKICINGSWFNAGSPEAIDQVGTTVEGIPVADIYPHNVKTVYVKISPASNPQWASPTVYDLVVNNISPNTLARPIYLLTELEPEGVPDLYYSLYDLPERIDPADSWVHGGMLYRVEGNAFRNQIEYVEDPAQCDGALSCYIRKTSNYYIFRNQQMWWGAGFIYTNIPYPTDSQCSIDTLE